MVVPTFTRKGATMSNQRLLFEPSETVRTAKIWEQLSSRDKQRVIAILAQMGKRAVTNHPTAGRERSDES
jgi:hypothetical protein